MSFSEKSGLDTLIDTPVERAVDFALGSSVARAALSGTASDFCILPERGSMPVYWAAQGLQGMEAPIPVDELRIPLGTNISEGSRDIGGLTKPEKIELIEHALHTSGLGSEGTAVLLDEVQNGGTLSYAAKVIAHRMQNSNERLSVIAAQEVAFAQKTTTLAAAYKSIALNQSPLIKTATVVPIPLIATDKNPLLNTLVKRNQPELRIDTRNNLFAELVCRALGSIARRADIGKPSELLTTLLYTEGKETITSKPDSEIEQWANDVTAGIVQKQKRGRD